MQRKALSMLIDTHCHLNYLHDGDLDALRTTLAHAKAQGVGHCICISVDLAKMPEVLKIGEMYENVKVSVGVHPCDVTSHTVEKAAETLSQRVSHSEVIAIGECGLDYYHQDGLDMGLQKKYFAMQIEMACRHHLPLVVHTRQARSDTIDVLRSCGHGDARGVLHCFTESKEMAKQALDLGFFISFSGIITFKNALELQEVVEYVPLDRLLVETDSPYLAPVPFRGKQNQPAYVVEVARKVAELKNVSFDQVCKQTTKNAQELFAWPV